VTLIITALADDAVVHVSDRRLTYSDRSVFSEEANKVICFDCADARVSLAYTGLALIGTKPTDHWLVDLLNDNHLANQPFPKAVEIVAKLATERFRALRYLGKHRKLSLVFSGFGPGGPLLALVSNFEDSSGKFLSQVSDFFAIQFFLRNESVMPRLGIVISGAEAAVKPYLVDAIKRIRKKYLAKSPEERVNVLVQVLRRAAMEPRYGGLIGQECMSVIVTREGGFHAMFHPSVDTPISYAPHYVSSGMSVKDIWISIDDNQRPSWAPPRNQN